MSHYLCCDCSGLTTTHAEQMTMWTLVMWTWARGGFCSDWYRENNCARQKNGSAHMRVLISWLNMEIIWDLGVKYMLDFSVEVVSQPRSKSPRSLFGCYCMLSCHCLQHYTCIHPPLEHTIHVRGAHACINSSGRTHKGFLVISISKF